MPHTAYIAFGSNLGDREATFDAAVKAIEGLLGVVVARVSDPIETDPAGGPAGQGKYLNAVIEVHTTLTPQDLLAAALRIERDLGRDRRSEGRWGARTCDLDLLLYDDLVLDTPALTLPHPRLHERLFVLQPLAQLAPDLRHPVLGKTIRELLEELTKTA